MDSSRVPSHPGIDRTRSYSVNSYLGGDGGGISPRIKARFSDLTSPGPSRTFVFIEEHENSIWTSGFLVVPAKQAALVSNAAIISSTPSDRHDSGAHLTFADAHAEFWRWYAPKGEPLTGLRLSGSALERLDNNRLQAVIPQP